MNSRERIATALAHREPDRLPRDLGGTESSGMHALELHKLSRSLCLDCLPEVFEPFQYVAHTPAALRKQFKIDTLNLTPAPREWIEQQHPFGMPVLLPAEWHEKEQADGSTAVLYKNSVVAQRPRDGYYFDPVNPSLANLSSAAELQHYEKQIRGFDWPFFADESDEEMAQRARVLHKEDKCVVLNLCCHLLAAGQLLRGYENFMVDLLTDEFLVNALFEMLLSGYFERIDRLAPKLEKYVDVVLLNDDLGTQQGPMLSPEVYRKHIKPAQKRLFEYAKENFQSPLLFHSCGSIRAFLPDLVEIGVDAINPVQITAEKMAPADLKKDFGDVLTFWGGGVDTQAVLNSGTPAVVKESVRRNVDILAPGGGFVFCQVHNIQPDVPPENVLAMYEALEDCV